MKKIFRNIIILILIIGAFFIGGNAISNLESNDSFKSIDSKAMMQMQNNNLLAASLPGNRYVGKINKTITYWIETSGTNIEKRTLKCGDIIYVERCIDGGVNCVVTKVNNKQVQNLVDGISVPREYIKDGNECSNNSTPSQNIINKSITTKPNFKISLNTDISSCTFSNGQITNGNAKLQNVPEGESYTCKFISTSEGTFYVNVLLENNTLYKYTITVKGASSETPSATPPANTVVVPVSEVTPYYRYSKGATSYLDAGLSLGKKIVPCGQQVKFQDKDGKDGMTQKEIDGSCVYGPKADHCVVIYEAGSIYIERKNLTLDPPYCEENPIDNPTDNPSNESIEQNSYYYINDYDNPNYTGSANELSCGDKVYISICIDSNGVCDVEKINGKSVTDTYVKKAALQKSASGLNCEVKDEEETDEIEKCNPVSPLKNQKSKTEKKIKVCFNVKNGKETAVKENEKEVFTCVNGYRRNMRAVSNTCDKLNKSSKTQLCSKEFMYSCNSVLRPTLEGSGSLENNGKGTITIKGKDSASKSGLKGYFIYTDKTPTSSSIPESFNGNSYEAKKEFTPGTYFASVITNDGILSYPLTLSIHSDEITTTAEIILASPDGNLNYAVTALEKGKIGYESTVSSSDYVRLSNQLNNDSMLATGFDLFTTGYEVTVEADQIAVFATLKSTDARYVDGYGSRTVDLNYGRNVILVKIVNNKGHERTYTFVVNRTDNRENKNILSNLTTSVGKINFDPYVSDYTISVPKNATSVTINGTLASSEASFIEGYQPRVVILDNDITSAVIKTISKAGITRNYILTFVKTGSDVEVDYEDSVYLSSLTIAGKDLLFEKDNLSYSASVDYETEDVTVYAFAESPNAVVDIRGNYGLQVGPNKIEVLVTNGSNSKMYNIFINRKEDGLNVSGNTKLETLTVKDYDILFNPDVEDYSIKIKKEKTLLLTATPQSDRSEVYMYGNNDLTAYSTIRIKVIAENGDTGLYSVDIIKDLYDKDLETTAAIIGSIIIFGAVIIIIVRKKRKSLKDYIEV